MSNRWPILMTLLAGGLALAACQGADTAGDQPGVTAEPSDAATKGEESAADTPQGAQDAGRAGSADVTAGLDPQEVMFNAAGDISIAAWYYPPVGEGAAPGVLLMHQMRADKSAWQPLIERLRQERPDLAVFAIDFPGHGDSGGPYSNEAALAAAEAALDEFRGYEAVADDQIVMIGASIGSDAAVDACGTGCAGAVSISPGGWLGIDYTDALSLIDVPVMCMAAQNDGSTAQTCQNGADAGLASYDVHIYDGSKHGNSLAADDSATPSPAPADLIIGWLGEHLPPTS